jgi:16S rRNA (cytosine967-C5)-methyltransferase
MLAVMAIADVLDDAESLAEADSLKLDQEEAVDPRDAAFARHLAYGVLRWLTALEWLADQFLDRPLKRRDRDIRRLILVGLFELWKGESGAHAAVNETAECARRAGKPWAVGLINAVLRRFQREQATWLERLESRSERYAHPEWFIQKIQADWPQQWREVLDANNRQAGLWLRVNPGRASVESVSKALEQGGFETRAHPHAPHAVEVMPPAPVERLPGFVEGWWSVQDPAAQLASEWLDVEGNHRVLDACAAPGGKTCHILEAAPQASVLAVDRSETRLSRLFENAERLGLATQGRLEVRAGDVLDAGTWKDGERFDRILLDAPCTATGVIRRHPEIKWLRSPEQVEEAVQLQSGLLEQLWPLLEPGGILVYATCSVLGDENSRQIRRFMDGHGDARLEVRQLPYGASSDSGCQILPGTDDMDGFFYARLHKNA